MKKIVIISAVAVVFLGFIMAQILSRVNKESGNTITPSSTPSLDTSFTLSSPAFPNLGVIPIKYTCDSDNISPPLQISNIPKNTVSLVLIIDDIDSPRGTFVHWLVWNIEPSIKDIQEGITPSGAGVGVNDFREVKYGGPCPSTGEHRYVFALYALDNYLVFTEKTNKSQVIDAMNGHVIEKTSLTGIYSR